MEWTKQDPNLVPGLILSADTEKKFYWLQVYQHGRFFESAIYGVTTEGRFDLMGRELCTSIEEAKKHAESEWSDFQQRSRLYPTAANRSIK